MGDRLLAPAHDQQPGLVALRGRLLREFVGGDEPLAVNWRIVRIGRGVGAKTYRLADYRREYPEPENRSEASEPRAWQDDSDESNG